MWLDSRLLYSPGFVEMAAIGVKVYEVKSPKPEEQVVELTAHHRVGNVVDFSTANALLPEFPGFEWSLSLVEGLVEISEQFCLILRVQAEDSCQFIKLLRSIPWLEAEITTCKSAWH